LRAAVLLFDAVQDDKDAFEKAAPERQQRWLENARTLIPMDAGSDPPPVTCEQLAALKVPALVMRGEHTRPAFRYGNESLVGCLPKGTQSAVVPGAPHIWYPVNPEAGAKIILGFIAKP
jgi:pimeloyl-ACP methyl ester carboxylesterase